MAFALHAHLAFALHAHLAFALHALWPSPIMPLALGAAATAAAAAAGTGATTALLIAVELPGGLSGHLALVKVW